MRVLTLNLWNVNPPLEARFAALDAGLKALRPDIVCLQEVAPDPRSGTSQAEIVAGMCGIAHFVQIGALAIVCRWPLGSPRSTALPDVAGDEPRQVLLTQTQIDNHPVFIANTHFAHHLDWVEGRRMQAQALLAALKSETAPVILCGDFNDVPDSPAMRLIAVADAFRDTYAVCHPGSAGHTYTRANPYVPAGWPIDQRIDFILVRGVLTPLDCKIVFDGKAIASDHYGVFSQIGVR